MSGKLLTIAPALLMSLAAPASAQDAPIPDGPKQLGELFCELTKDGGQFTPQYLLTASLVEAIQAGLKKNDEWAAAHPGEKPPLGDGIQFASFPDGAPVCRVGTITDGQDGAKLLDIQYIVGAALENNWTDRLVLKTEDGLPRIDDVLYGTEKYNISLRKSLIGRFEN
jgi:hypothetical protein